MYVCMYVEILNEQFFVNGVFQKTKRNGLEWKEAFIKYVCWVLKSFLITNLDSTQNDLSNEVRLEEIEMDKIRNSTLFQSANQENQRS